MKGYLGPDMGKGRWLFVWSNKTNSTYPVARTVDGQVVEYEEEQQLSSYTNQEVADALLSGE